MKREQLVALMAELEKRVRLAENAEGGDTRVVFDAPSADDLVAAGTPEVDARRLLGAAWWHEMVEEIIETPSFCGAEEPPEQVLRYARDVVSEYIRKRFPLEAPKNVE